MEKSVNISKQIGETPLEALERFRAEQMENAVDPETKKNWQEVPMTYAGRLDPLAEGELLILVGDECRNKSKYLGLDKEYEVEVVFGVETDTYDALGIASKPIDLLKDSTHSEVNSALNDLNVQKYAGTFTQEYPPYSSRTVDGVALHELARADKLPEEMPAKEVIIFEIEELRREEVTGLELEARILDKVDLVNGDFRQEAIRRTWNAVLDDGISGGEPFDIVTIRVKCSSGTYMRSLAHRMGKDLGVGAIALGIRRTKIFVK
ncbi:MAG: hypothetical protein KBC33_01525 [Candidatus Pacebacteria bacterium]|nr:hypothetical protein [Candidatus Paceibacterota bacterium]